MKISCFDCPFFYIDVLDEQYCHLSSEMLHPDDPECNAPEACPLTKGWAVVVTYIEDKGFQIDY